MSSAGKYSECKQNAVSSIHFHRAASCLHSFYDLWLIFYFFRYKDIGVTKLDPFDPLCAPCMWYDSQDIISKAPLNCPHGWVSNLPPKRQEENTAGRHGFWPHVDPLRATQDQWECLFFFFFRNSRVVLQPEEEMIYVDLISPLWWQTYDQMINGQLEKQENYWRDL